MSDANDDHVENGQPRNGTQSSLSEKSVGFVLLKPRSVLSGSLEVLIPEGFTQMDEEMKKKKYPAEKRPSLVYTNENGSVNIAMNHTHDPVAPNQLEQLHQSLDTATRGYVPSGDWLFSGFQHYNGRKWTQLEFKSSAADTEIHNIMAATSADNRMLVVSFNATAELAEEWVPVGKEVMKSLTVFD